MEAIPQTLTPPWYDPRTSVLTLRVISKAFHGMVFVLAPGDNTIGRDADCEISLNNPTLSRRHCLITVDEQLVKAQDLQSLHGIKVNTRSVLEQRMFKRDILTVGDVELILETRLAPKAQPKPKIEPRPSGYTTRLIGDDQLAPAPAAAPAHEPSQPSRPAAIPPPRSQATAHLTATSLRPGQTRRIAHLANSVPLTLNLEESTVTLRVLDGPLKGASFPLRPGLNIVGREHDFGCDVEIQDETVLPQHCAIAVAENQITVADFSASPTVKHNDLPIIEAHLRPHDRLTLGAVPMIVELQHPDPEASEAVQIDLACVAAAVGTFATDSHR